MPLTGHLTELRKRIIIFFVALVVGFGVSFYFSETLFQLLTLPTRKDMVFSPSYPFLSFVQRLTPPPQMVFLAPAEALWMYFKIALVAGLVLSLPIALWQLWGFVAPGLSEKEKRYAAPFVIAATLLFSMGAMFCFFLVLPFAMSFLLSYQTQFIKPMLSVGMYVDFCLKFILAFGVVFELPAVLVVLTRLGIVSPDTLAKHRKYALLMAFVAAAFLTPTPDAFNQTMMAVPIIVLYEAGIIFSRILARKGDSDDKREKLQGDGD